MMNPKKYENVLYATSKASNNSNKLVTIRTQTSEVDEDQYEFLESDDSFLRKPKKLRIKIHGKLDRSLAIRIRHKPHKRNNINNNSNSPHSITLSKANSPLTSPSRHHSHHSHRSSFNSPSPTRHHSHNSPLNSSSTRHHSHHNYLRSRHHHSHTNSPSKVSPNIESFDDERCKVIPVLKEENENSEVKPNSTNRQFNIKIRKNDYQTEKNFSSSVSEMKILFSDDFGQNQENEDD